MLYSRIISEIVLEMIVIHVRHLLKSLLCEHETENFVKPTKAGKRFLRALESGIFAANTLLCAQ